MNVKRTISIASLMTAAMLSSAFAQSTTFTTVSGGTWLPITAPDSIAAGFGTALATSTTPAGSLPLPTTLGNATVSVTDSAGKTFAAQLFMVSSGQINFLVPAAAALGKGSVSVSSNSQTFTGPIEIGNIAPGIFTANGNGVGVPAAQVVNVAANGTVTMPSPFQVGPIAYIPAPIDISSGKVFLVLYGTGIRRHSGNPVKATIGGIAVPVAYAGAQSTLPGLDQINLGPLPQTLAGGKGDVNLVVTVDGIPANTTRINIK